MKPRSKKSPHLRPNWKLAALLAATLPLTALTGCAHKSRPSGEMPNIWQPYVLTIEAGATVETPEGPYRAQTRETWHGDKRFRELEQAYLDLLGNPNP